MRYRARKKWVKKYAGFKLVYHGRGSAKVRRWLINCTYALAHHPEVNAAKEATREAALW